MVLNNYVQKRGEWTIFNTCTINSPKVSRKSFKHIKKYLCIAYDVVVEHIS